jgi:hypothetical protein
VELLVLWFVVPGGDVRVIRNGYWGWDSDLVVWNS